MIGRPAPLSVSLVGIGLHVPIEWRCGMTPKHSRIRCGIETLENFEIFRGLPAEAVESYSKRCTWRRFETRQTLIEHKDTSQSVFFIYFGRARATCYAANGREISF